MRQFLLLISAIFLMGNASTLVATGDAAVDPTVDEKATVEETLALQETQIADLPVSQLASDIVPLRKDELEDLANEALDLAQQRTSDMVNARKDDPRRIAGASSDQAAVDAYDKRMADLLVLRGDAFTKLSIILEEWEEKGGDPEKISEYRAYRLAVQSDTLEKATFAGIIEGLEDWAVSPDGGIRVLKGIGIFLVSLVLLFIIARLISAAVKTTMSHMDKASKLLQTFIALVVYWVVVLFGIALIIASLGFDVTPVFALLGGASFILAFALQETLGNFAAGLMILVYRPFDAGERVIAAGIDGNVERLSLTSTIIRTPDNQLVTIPNSKVWNDVIYNAVDLDTRRIDLEYIIPDPRQAVEAMDSVRALLSEQADVLKDPEPGIYIGGHDGRGARLQVRPWAKSSKYWPVRRQVAQAIMSHFAESEIELWKPPVEDLGST